MAYYPSYGNPSYGYPYSPTYPQYTTPPVMPQTTPQAAQEQPKIQSGGFINVRSIDEAKNYPVEPGKSITFKVENTPYLCTKTMGFSQLDQPHFEKYRLVKEEEATPKVDEPIIREEPKPEYALKSELEDIKARVGEIENSLKAPKKKSAKLLEESEDDGV